MSFDTLVPLGRDGFSNSKTSDTHVHICRHSKDWVCRIDVRRTFGMKASQIQSAVNIATDFLAQQPKEKIELFFRRGTYLIDSKVIYKKSWEPVFRLLWHGHDFDALFRRTLCST